MVRLWRSAFAGLLAAAALAAQDSGPQAIVQEGSHNSQVMESARTYRVFLPPDYKDSKKRYPVLYWLRGPEAAAEQERYEGEIAAYVARHDLIVVATGPVETVGRFPLYLPELIDQVDRTLRTVADRDHRGVTGYSAGGFMAFWLGGKFPDLVSSASSFMGPTEYNVGPKGFDVESNFDDFYANYDGVRTRLVTGTRDFIRFYHRRLNAVWSLARANHETEEFDSDHGTPGLARTFDFHMQAFAHPLPKPAVFSHADVYPNFTVWGWEVASGRKWPGVTMLEQVSATGFRSAVREWIPGGATMPEVRLAIASPKSYAPGSVRPVTIVKLRDGSVRRLKLKADAEGRLNFDLDGDECEVGIGAEPVLAVSGYEIEGAAWATAGKPVKLRVKFVNKGGARQSTAAIQWESPNPDVKFEPASGRLFGLDAGESAALPVTVTVADASRPLVQVVAAVGGVRLPIRIPLFPEAEATKDFQIGDGRALTTFQHGMQRAKEPLGKGNGDGFAAPGESFAILIPDGDGYRAAEIFTNSACVDTSVRASDSWSNYDHTGASVKYSLLTVRADCAPGTPVRVLARVVMPNAPEHRVRYWSLEFPVWWKMGAEGAK